MKIHQAQAKNFCRVLDIRVPEIVIPDLSHPLRLEQLRKALCDIVRLYQIANLIDTYILKIFLDVAASAQAAVFLLLFFQGEKSFPHERNKRQCSHTRFGLSRVRCNQNALAVEITRSNRVTDRDGVLVKVDGIPFQTDCFTPAQAVERTEQNRKLKFAAFCSLEKSVDFIGIIEAADVTVFLRTLNLIRRVYINQVNLHGTLESLVNIGVIMNDRGRADTLKLTQVKLLNVFCGQVLERHFLFAEVRCYNLLNRSRV